MFEELRKIAKHAKEINFESFFNEAWSDEYVQEIIIDLNTAGDLIRGKGQLYHFGIDSKGEKLYKYAEVTKKYKKLEGHVFDRVTLSDTGKFYASFYVVPDSNGFKIIADPQDGRITDYSLPRYDIYDPQDLEFFRRNQPKPNLFERYGEDIVGLTDESKEILIKSILTNLQNALRGRILFGRYSYD